MPVAKDTVFEKHFNDYLSKLIYAVFADIERDADSTHSAVTFQSYENMIKPKDKQLEGLKARFTINIEVKMMLTVLFKKMCEECNNVKNITSQTMQGIVAEIAEQTNDCYSQFMCDCDTYSKYFKDTLKGASEHDGWFTSQLNGFLPAHTAKPLVIAFISQLFHGFMKVLAWKMGQLLFRSTHTINGGFLAGILSQLAMETSMVDTLLAEMKGVQDSRPKKTSAPKKDAKEPPKTEDAPANDESAALLAELDRI